MTEIKVKRINKQILINIVSVLGLVLVIVLFEILSKGVLLEKRNFQSLINQAFTLIIVSIGAIFLYAHAGINMAFGATMIFSGMCGIYAARVINPWLCLPVCIISGLFCYIIMGMITTRFNVPPFVGSMCGKYVFQGIVQTVLSANGILLPVALYQFNSWAWKILAIVIVFVIGYILLEHTKLGKYDKAIGGNELTASQAGIEVNKYKMYAYMIAGVCVGIAAFFTLCRNGSADSTSGNGLELNVMTAIVLGGLPLTGGARTRITSSIIGACTITVLTNGLVLIGASQAIAQGIQGLLFLAVVYISYEKNKGGLLA